MWSLWAWQKERSFKKMFRTLHLCALVAKLNFRERAGKDWQVEGLNLSPVNDPTFINFPWVASVDWACQWEMTCFKERLYILWSDRSGLKNACGKCWVTMRQEMQESAAKDHAQGCGGRGGKPETFPFSSSDKMAYKLIHLSKCSINMDNGSNIFSVQVIGAEERISANNFVWRISIWFLTISNITSTKKIIRHFTSYGQQASYRQIQNSLIIAAQKHVNSDYPKVQSVFPKCDQYHGNSRSYYKMHEHCCLVNLSCVFT